MILWGPAGTGKTTLARILASSAGYAVESLSAVTSGVKDVREALSRAHERLGERGQRTVLFIDEVHRFNKSQQDLLLPATETGEVVLIGATTENPYFEVNAALMSRSTLWRLHPLSPRTSKYWCAADWNFAEGHDHRRGARGHHRLEPTVTRARAHHARHGDRAGAREDARTTRPSTVEHVAQARDGRLYHQSPTPTTTRSAPSSSRCAVRTPTPRSTGSSHCSRAARARGFSRDDWSSSPVRTSDSPTPWDCWSPKRPRGPSSSWDCPRVASPWPTRRSRWR
jgi:hypothetical protein